MKPSFYVKKNVQDYLEIRYLIIYFPSIHAAFSDI